MPLDRDEAKWVDDLVRWLMGLDDPRTDQPHHRREALYAAAELTARARQATPKGLSAKEVRKLWIFECPKPVKRRALADLNRTP